MKHLNELTQLCSPPAAKEAALSMTQWNVQFRAIGSRLPEALVQLHNTYGSGFFQSVRSPSNGSFGIYAATVAASAIARLAELRLAKLKYPNAFPAGLYFEPGGLLPIGWVAGDIDLCLRVAGDNPDKWPVSLLHIKSRQVHHLEQTLLPVVLSMVAGELTSELFSQRLPSAAGYRFQPATESVPSWHAG